LSRIGDIRVAAGRRFARAVTVAVMRTPRLWPVFRGALRLQFQTLAPRWDELTGEDHLAPYEEALAAVPDARRALDLGTGTGAGAFAIARRFPEADVLGLDLASAMVEQARANTPAELEGRVSFDVADASRLPYADGAFDLVALSNMIPFFDELGRVVAPGGHALIAFSSGAETPIYVPLERLEAELQRLGFTHFAPVAAGRGTALLAQKGAAENTSG
jgi:ubiquinone/menaquinone biosynthesis C-methylase UbiE